MNILMILIILWFITGILTFIFNLIKEFIFKGYIDLDNFFESICLIFLGIIPLTIYFIRKLNFKKG